MAVLTMDDAQAAVLITTHYPAHYSLLIARYSQWPRTADAHPAIRALQRLLAELLTANEPGAEVVAAEVAQAGYWGTYCPCRPRSLLGYLLSDLLAHTQACGKLTVEDLASHRLLASLSLLEPLDTLFVLDR